MATGNLTNPRIIAAGNVLEFDVDAGAWANDIDVIPESFSITGTSESYTGDTLVTASRTCLTGLRATYLAGVLSVYMADSIYQSDTAFTVQVDAGAISDGTDVNAALPSTVITNNSTIGYPLAPVRIQGAAVGRNELIPQFGVVDSTNFRVEADSYGKYKVSAVRFTITGNGGSPVNTYVVTARTRSIYQDTAIITNAQWAANGDGGVGVFSTPEINPTDYPDGPITVLAESFGVFGNAASIVSDSCWLLNNNGGTYTEVTRWADSVNGSDVTGDGTEGNPYASWEVAGEQAGTAANPSFTDPTLMIPRVILKTGDYTLARLGFPNADNLTWHKTSADPLAAVGSVRIRSTLSSGTIPRARFIQFDGNVVCDVSDGSDGSYVFLQNNSSVYPDATKPAHVLISGGAEISHALGRDGQISGSTQKFVGANYGINSKIIYQAMTATEMYQVGINAGIDQTYVRNCRMLSISNDFIRNSKSVFATYGLSNRISDDRVRITSLVGTPLPGDILTGDNGVDPIVQVTVVDFRVSGSDNFVFIDTSAGQDVWDLKDFDNTGTVTFSPSGASGTLLFDHPDGVQYTGEQQIGLVSNFILQDCDGQSFFLERGTTDVMVYNFHSVNTNGTASFNTQIGDSNPIYDHNNVVCDYVTLASQLFRMREGGNFVSDFALRNSVVKGAVGWEQPGVLFNNIHQYSDSVFEQYPLDRTTDGPGGFVNGTGQDENYDAAKVDFRPDATSVLRNRIASGEQLVEFDLFGVARPDDGTGAIGAFEYSASVPMCITINNVTVIA